MVWIVSYLYTLENKMGLGKVFFFGQMDRRMDECWGLEARGLRLEATKNKKPIPFDPAIFFSFFFFLFFSPPTTGVSNPVRSHDFSDKKKIAGSNGIRYPGCLFFVLLFCFLFFFVLTLFTCEKNPWRLAHQTTYFFGRSVLKIEFA